MVKRILSLLVVVCLFVCGLPLSAAATAGDFVFEDGHAIRYNSKILDSGTAVPTPTPTPRNNENLIDPATGKLYAPKNLKWGVYYDYDSESLPWAGSAAWEVEKAVDGYTLRTCLYSKTSGKIDQIIYSGAVGYREKKMSCPWFHLVDFSGNLLNKKLPDGDYYFTAQAIQDESHESPIDSEIVVSETWTYKRPPAQLEPIPKKDLRWEKDMAMYGPQTSTANCYGYQVKVAYADDLTGTGKDVVDYFLPVAWGNSGTRVLGTDGGGHFDNPDRAVHFRVRRLSVDVNKYQNSEWSEWSDPYIWDGTTGKYPDVPKITTETLQTVPDGVIDVPYQAIIQTSLGESMSKSHELVIESGELPQGLLLESDGELHGIPSQAGEYEFTVALKGLNSKDIVDRRSYKVKVIESTTENVAEVNTSAQGYRLLDPLPDVIDFDKVEQGAEFTFRSEGPFDQLEAVYIDGDELVPEVEYTATEGSCVITVSDMGYGGRISGRHVISATFKKPGTQGNFNMRKTAQAVSFVNPKPRPIPKYTINLDCAWGGAAIVSNKSAEAGKTVTVTAKPFYGWEINRVTAGSAKVTKNGDKYTFAMPASAVTVKVSFKRLGAAEGTGMPFFDVKTTDWFYTPVKEVYEAGLMVGTSSNAFSPYHPALRGMIAVILYSHAGSPAVEGACPFTDVKAGAYYEKAVTWAKQSGVISGTSATRFSPSGKITREQLVTMLYSYAGSPEANGDLSRFTDVDRLSSWASNAMSWAVENGLISGKGNNRLDPKGNATRAEIATVLQKFMVMQYL